MNVLMLSSDRNAFAKDSAVAERMREYGAVFETLHVIVVASRALGYVPVELRENVFVYPTDHRTALGYFSRVIRIASSVHSKRRITVVTAQDPFEIGLAGFLLKLLKRIPLQIQVHTDLFSPAFRGESVLHRFRIALAKFLLPRADGIRVVSERVRRSLLQNIRALRKPPVVLPIAIPRAAFTHAAPRSSLRARHPGAFIFLLPSRLTREKNVGLAIRAIAALKDRCPRAALVIVGDGPEKNRLESMRRELRVADRVAFEPWTDDLASYYKTGDVLLMTSNYEGYGRTPVEALAAGMPGVMTDVGIAGEAVRDGVNGLVVPVGDPEAFAQAMYRMASDRSFFLGLKRRAGEGLENVILEKGEYLRAYREALEECL